MPDVSISGRGLTEGALHDRMLPDRLPVRITLPLLAVMSTLLWVGIYFAFRWALGW
jgi:hypothetical protein